MNPLASVMNNPLFSVYSLTAAINRLPYQPSVIGDLDLFTPKPQATTQALIERRGNVLALVPDQPRGGPAVANVQGARDAVEARIPHFPIRDSLLADSLL